MSIAVMLMDAERKRKMKLAAGEQKSPDELRALNKVREAKKVAALEEAKRKTYSCLYNEINKDMAEKSRLSGIVTLSGDCLESFKHALRGVRESKLTQEFDYRPLGWEKADLKYDCWYPSQLGYSFE